MAKKQKTMLRLDKYLGDLGYGTRKELRKMIKDGRVTVDGEIIYKPETRVSIKESLVCLDGEKIEYIGLVYLMMNKPPDVISATRDPHGQETVIDLLPDDYYYIGLSPVGRLDKDTVGLILLTNDGKYNHQATSPKKDVPKIYYAIVRGHYSDSFKEMAKEGITLDDDYKCKPAELFTIEEYINNLDGDDDKEHIEHICRKNLDEELIENIEKGNCYEAIIIISEGKYHQVKRMFKSFNHNVEYLKRIGFDGFILPKDLEQGEVVEIDITKR